MEQIFSKNVWESNFVKLNFYIFFRYIFIYIFEESFDYVKIFVKKNKNF